MNTSDIMFQLACEGRVDPYDAVSAHNDYYTDMISTQFQRIHIGPFVLVYWKQGVGWKAVDTESTYGKATVFGWLPTGEHQGPLHVASIEATEALCEQVASMAEGEVA